jgi:hypothetical protein
MIEDMNLRGFQDKTQRGYIRIVSAVAQYLGRSPETATPEDVRTRASAIFRRHWADLERSRGRLEKAQELADMALRDALDGGHTDILKMAELTMLKIRIARTSDLSATLLEQCVGRLRF